jgi:predicted dehydrogenase
VSSAVRMACAGIGGYAWSIAQQMMAASGEGNIQLVAMCDPALDQFADRVSKLESLGINAYSSFERMLETEQCDAVWLPLPIHLHRPFTETALSRGKHVVTEKPAAGSLQDVDAMIAARDNAKREVLVGFQDIYAAPTVPAKQAVLDGAIGQVKYATVHASWPRDLTYFGRNKWAGAIKVGDTWVLDSPLQNAISHYLNLAVFLLGGSVHESASPTEVEAELYRANDIQNYDTCALRLHLSSGIPVIVFFTHADREHVDATVVLQGSAGSLTVNSQGYRIDSTHAKQWPADERKHANMLRNVARHLRGQAHDGAVATLEMARIHTTIVNGVSEAALIMPFDRGLVTEAATGEGKVLKAVPGLKQVMLRCVAERKLPSELGDVAWAKKGGTKRLANYNAFAGPKQA